jgi:hypothetical protein
MDHLTGRTRGATAESENLTAESGLVNEIEHLTVRPFSQLKGG